MKQKEKKETNPKSTFVCQRCGYCCIYSSPSLTREEYNMLKRLPITKELKVIFKKYNFRNKVINGSIVKEYCYFTENGYYNFMYANNVVAYRQCEFLSKDEQGKYYCLIYSHRPQVCKDFGILDEPRFQCPKQKEQEKQKKQKEQNSFFKKAWAWLFMKKWWYGSPFFIIFSILNNF